jgi:nicotinate-nucleotide pyrophosphorylase (carboxylating)
LTAQFVAAVSGCSCRIVDTRKTTPGLRILEKYAVRVGGGFNHRIRLDDGVLIKNNHITAAGGVGAAVVAARAGTPHGLKVEVECATLEEVTEALGAGADIIMLDNMSLDQITEAVRRIAGRAVVEVSGGITLETVRAVAHAGVDIISVGALTHSAPAVDLHMRLVLA